jgi:hypothetical protein
MNLDKAQEIVKVVSEAIEGKKTTLQVRRKSDLKGFTISEIDTACKLITAWSYLEFTGTPEDAALFKKVVDNYGFILIGFFMTFQEDKECDELEKMDRSTMKYKRKLATLVARSTWENNPEYKKFLELESIESFGNFCRHVGRDDPIYWQKIYTHLGLRYDPDSPIRYGDINLNEKGNLERKYSVLKEEHESNIWSKAKVWIYIIIGAIILYFILKES